MLEHKDDIKYHCDNWKEEFDYVESITATKINKLLILIPIIKPLLAEWEETAGEVEEHVA